MTEERLQLSAWIIAAYFSLFLDISTLISSCLDF